MNTDNVPCSKHRLAGQLPTCTNCGGEHPVEEDDGCICYYACLPGVRLGRLLEALLACGCAPKRVRKP
jgi:hypothetical protein